MAAIHDRFIRVQSEYHHKKRK